MIHGILNVYKEKGYTSHDVVAKLRGITGQKKIGHTGTLDPDAEGVLPVCFGKATKICDLLTEKEKEYEAVLFLGKKTDTQDLSGKVLEERSISDITETKVREVIQTFVGEYRQIPPMYSALKVNGKKLYELARAGKTVERKARTVIIFSIVIQEISLPRVRMLIHCSKGTYIRTLCEDIGEKLGCGGCMEELLRTSVSSFSLKDSLKLEEIIQKKENRKLESVILPVEDFFSGFPKFHVKKEWEKKARNGNCLSADMVCEKCPGKEGREIRLYSEEGRFIALYQWKDKEYHLRKMFFNEI